MLFSSINVLFYFLPAVIILYIAAPKKLKNLVLLISSLFFYFWGEKLLVLLFAFTIFLGWISGLLLEKTEKKPLRKLILVISVVIDLGLLGYYKYADFFIENVNAVFRTSIPLLKIALPIGISFYTFQLLSYTVDVYRRDVPAQKNLIDLAAYVAMFPQLIAGPIVRYADVEGSLKVRTHSLDKVSEGIRRFIIGLGKKVLLANAFGEICTAFRSASEPSVLYYWIYAFAYCLQIYFDFSGYSDMAIGLGKLFGFEFMENFNYPFISSSITEFWRRWHISLGSWFRDYVYIPLGGNRCKKGRQLFNILVVWMLTGLWHGAEWNFVFWGIFYAILLTVEKLGFKKILDKNKLLGHIYVVIATLFGFMLFNSSSLSQYADDIINMFAFRALPFANIESLYALRSCGFMLIIGIIGATPLPSYLMKKAGEKGGFAIGIIKIIGLLLILIVVTAYLVDGSFNPFLYFRF